jgi:hypothetical protein
VMADVDCCKLSAGSMADIVGISVAIIYFLFLSLGTQLADIEMTKRKQHVIRILFLFFKQFTSSIFVMDHN